MAGAVMRILCRRPCTSPSMNEFDDGKDRPDQDEIEAKGPGENLVFGLRDFDLQSGDF
jgi:hypothetical protein